MIRQLIMSAAVLTAFAVGSVNAGEMRQVSGVVELFTSQGCSSCPPADRVLTELADEGEVIALGYHVDYWDYLGWKDTLGSAEYTARQYGYARTFKERSVYTPQAVVNGKLHLNGAARGKIDREISRIGLPVDLSVSKVDERFVIQAGEGNAEVLGDAHLVLVFFDRARDVEIRRGENHGKTITYANIVTGIQTAGMWHGQATSFELPMSEIAKRGDGGCAVLLQVVSKDGSPGAILGAAMLEHG